MTNEENMIYYADDNEQYQAGKYQGIIRSQNSIEYIPEINIWGFPDAADFGSLLLDKNGKISQEMEDYALQVLTCFCPLHTVEDLSIDCSYVKKF